MLWDNKIDTALHCNLILKYLHYKILSILKYNQFNYFGVKKIRNNEISTSMYKYTFYVNIHGIICMNNKHILSTLSNFKVWIKTASCHKKKESFGGIFVKYKIRCLSVCLSSIFFRSAWLILPIFFISSVLARGGLWQKNFKSCFSGNPKKPISRHFFNFLI